MKRVDGAFFCVFALLTVMHASTGHAWMALGCAFLAAFWLNAWRDE